MKKLLALVLALIMALTAAAAFADDADWTAADYLAHADIRTVLEKDYTGKTVILHSNEKSAGRKSSWPTSAISARAMFMSATARV